MNKVLGKRAEVQLMWPNYYRAKPKLNGSTDEVLMILF
jgi:hypothetical protein